MKYKLLKKYIKDIIKEDFGFKRHQDKDNNSLNQTSDNGNLKYDQKLYKYYEISDYSDYNKLRDSETYYTVFEIKEDFLNKIGKKDRKIVLKTYGDIDSHELKRKNLVYKLYGNLKI